MTELKKYIRNISEIKERIGAVCARLNKNPAQITLVAISKGRTFEEIRQIIEAGITDIGENRVQEAVAKYRELSTRYSLLTTLRWHMVGHLQTNKVKEAVRIFDLIQSVDSIRLAAEIDKEAGKINKIQGILVQVNTAKEAAKYGLKPEETEEAIKEIARFKNVNIKGLMTIAPLVDNPEKTRPYFRTLRELRDEISNFGICNLEFGILSMGMTNDFEIAIEEASDMLRLGRAIFD